jgi:hypothetical protein
VQVIGQDANRNCFKGPPLLNSTVGLPQPIDFLDQQIARTVGENDREKEDTAFEICATIAGHDASYHA